jgi:hypothetical protein
MHIYFMPEVLEHPLAVEGQKPRIKCAKPLNLDRPLSTEEIEEYLKQLEFVPVAGDQSQGCGNSTECCQPGG